MTDTDKCREVRIVGYDKRLLVAQMQLLGAVLFLPAMALSHGWVAGFLGVVFFVLVLLVFAQVWKLRSTGLRITVEDVESESAETVEELPAEEEFAEPQAEETPPPSEPEEEPHWSDTAYPDPDVELGLAEDTSKHTGAQWSPTSNPESEE